MSESPDGQTQGGYQGHQEGSPVPGTKPPNDHPGIYQVRPDKNTTIIVAASFAVFAWLASQWAGGVSEDSTKALQMAERSMQINEQQSSQLDRLPDRIVTTITSAMQPLQQRVDDIRAQAGSSYSVESAQRDRAENQQTFTQIKAEINANQNTIQSTTGRVKVIEDSIVTMNRKLEQIYQAVINNGSSSRGSALTLDMPWEPITVTPGEGMLDANVVRQDD